MLYHVTLLKNINKILKEGIQPNKPQVWMKREFGRFPMGYIYGCTEYSDAVRWAFKTDWGLNEAHRLRNAAKIDVAIIGFNGNPDDWERDTHIEGHGLDGIWIKRKLPVSAGDLCTVILPAQWNADVKNVVYRAV